MKRNLVFLVNLVRKQLEVRLLEEIHRIEISEYSVQSSAQFSHNVFGDDNREPRELAAQSTKALPVQSASTFQRNSNGKFGGEGAARKV